jgi:DNA-binding response OmpR family regulator
MKILVVDDDSDIRETLRDLLEDEGYAVTTAANGADALVSLNADLPGLMILDLIMPVVDGNELLAAMQKDARLSAVPVIVSTSDPGRAPSGVLIMRKPVNLAHLLSVVRQQCGSPGAQPDD